MNLSHEYLASLVVIISSILALLKIPIGNEEITAVVTGGAALYVIFRKVQKGEISVLGQRK